VPYDEFSIDEVKTRFQLRIAEAEVEAKNDNLKSGLEQYMAEMVAIRLFNQRKGRELRRVYGVVTTGSLWKFMRLEGDVVFLDLREHPISEAGRVVGILVSILRPQDAADLCANDGS
jgi:hypothetical protein